MPSAGCLSPKQDRSVSLHTYCSKVGFGERKEMRPRLRLWIFSSSFWNPESDCDIAILIWDFWKALAIAVTGPVVALGRIVEMRIQDG
jgi:hypothetical protein